MKFRKQMKKEKSKKLFSKTAGTKKMNKKFHTKGLKRGGTRL